MISLLSSSFVFCFENSPILMHSPLQTMPIRAPSGVALHPRGWDDEHAYGATTPALATARLIVHLGVAQLPKASK